jgi:hypothetical protein
VVRLTAYHSTKVQSFNACSKIKTIMRNEVIREFWESLKFFLRCSMATYLLTGW